MGKEAFVYEWINLTNGKSYIGYHKGSMDDGYISSSHNKEFWNDFKNPEMKWVRKIIVEGTTSDCLKIEQKILKEIDIKNDIYYNNGRGAEVIFTKSVLDKMSNSQKKRWENMTEESKLKHSRKISESKKGIPRPKQMCDKLSKLLKGKSFIERYGSEKAKLIGEKISESNKGKHYHSEEFKQKLSLKFKGNTFGKNQSEEVKQKKRERFLSNNPGKNKSDETKRKISESKKGKPRLKKGEPQKKIVCPYCNKEGGSSGMQRWHFNNCKNK